MSFIRRTKSNRFWLLVILVFVSSIYIIRYFTVQSRRRNIDFTNFDNVLGSKEPIVPNIVHFIHFDKDIIGFVTFICILSVHYNQRPNIIFLHTNMDLHGRYYSTLVSVIGDKLKPVKTTKPSHVFGQKLSSVQHAADVARIKILLQYGGIVLDEDVFVVKSLNRFRHFELSLGWPQGQNIGTQIIVAHKQARFLPLWLSLYQEYRPSMWYYNAGEYPTERQNWTGWKDRHAIHLLSRHQEYLTNTQPLTEDNYTSCKYTLCDMVSSIMNELKDEDIVWSGEWLRLKDDSRNEEQRLKIEEFLNSSSTSLLHKHLSMNVFLQLSSIKTPFTQASFWDQIQSGIACHDIDIGLYATDPEAYTYFSLIVIPIIKDLHRVKGKLDHPLENWGSDAVVSDTIGDFSVNGVDVESISVTVVRSIEGFPFASKMTFDDYISLEQTVTEALSSLTGLLAGSYQSVVTMSETEKNKSSVYCDTFLKVASACNHWPAGRGIFSNTEGTFVVSVGLGGEHLKITSSSKRSGDLGRVYRTLISGMVNLQKAGLSWARSSVLGHLTFSPANIGTGLKTNIKLKSDVALQTQLNKSSNEWFKIDVLKDNGRSEISLSSTKTFGLTEYYSIYTTYKEIIKLLDNFKIS